MMMDSANARTNALNLLNSARTRCLDIWYKWVIEKIEGGAFKLDHVSGEEMVADGLTKPLTKEKHAQFVRMLGLIEKRVV